MKPNKIYKNLNVNMKNYPLFLAIILLFLIFIIGCTPQQEKEFREKYGSEIRNETKEVVKEAVKEALNESLEKQKIKCDDLPTNTQKYECYFQLAIENNATELCESLPTIYYSSNYGDNYNYKSNCYQKIARILKEEVICNNIEDKDIKDECYYLFIRCGYSNNTGFCEEITKIGPSPQYTLKDNCYYLLAVRLNEASLCGNIINSDSFGDICYRVISYNLDDLSLCNFIKSEKMRTQCLEKAGFTYGLVGC